MNGLDTPFVQEHTHSGISVDKRRDERSALDLCLDKGASRKFDGVICWNIVRLARLLQRLAAIPNDLQVLKLNRYFQPHAMQVNPVLRTTDLPSLWCCR